MINNKNADCKFVVASEFDETVSGCKMSWPQCNNLESKQINY